MSNSQSSVPRADKDLKASLAGASLGDLGDEDIIADGGTQIMVGGLADLGDEDIIADGGTQIMSREEALSDAPAATILAKGSAQTQAAVKFTAPSTVVAKIPPAPETQPIHELDPDDLEEDEQRRLERTQPFDRSRIFGAPWAPVMAPAPVVVAAVTPMRPMQPSLPSVVINEMPPAPARPGSIAPLAIDLPAVRTAPDATLKLPAVRVMPPKSNVPLVAGAIAAGLAFCAAAAIALVSLSGGSHQDGTASSPSVAAKPREAQKGAIRSAVIETPETTPQKAAAPEGARDEEGTPVFSASALPSAPAEPAPRFMSGGPAPAGMAPASRPAQPAHTTTPKAAPAPAPEPIAAPAPAPAPAPVPAAAPRPVSTTGIIEVPASLMTVMVDGEYRRVQAGRIVVTCGKHRVNAGRGTQTIDVPCGGVASVM